MDADDLEPRAKKPAPRDLVVMSVDALTDYIGELQAEITRARDAIAKKEKAKAGADAFFKS